MLLIVTDRFVFAVRIALNTFVTKITEFEVATQLGVPILEVKVVVTTAVQTPLLIKRSEGRTILMDAPESKVFLNNTVKV